MSRGVLASVAINASMPQSHVARVDAQAEAPVRADVLFKLLADPDKHVDVFPAIEGATSRLLDESGPRRRFELDYQARWRFWRISGVCENRLFMETDSEAGTVSFRLREPGFLKVYEGTWRITPQGQAALNLHTRTQAKQALASVPAPVVPTAQTTSTSPPWAAGLLGGLQQHGLAGMLAAIKNPLQGFGRPSWTAPDSPPPTLGTPMLKQPESVVEPRAPCPSLPTHSVVRVEGLRMSPKVAPPYPLGGLLKNHAASQVQEMLDGLVSAAQKLQADEDAVAQKLTADPLLPGREDYLLGTTPMSSRGVSGALAGAGAQPWASSGSLGSGTTSTHGSGSLGDAPDSRWSLGVSCSVSGGPGRAGGAHDSGAKGVKRLSSHRISMSEDMTD